VSAEVLLRYYRPETLQSDLARRVFLMPDRLLTGFSAEASRAVRPENDAGHVFGAEEV
jgi:hypothetical protein